MRSNNTPIGFDIIFPRDGNLTRTRGHLPKPDPVGSGLGGEFTISKPANPFKDKPSGFGCRSYLDGKKEYLAYVTDGMGKLQDWEEIMKYQRKNGSLFNSPSTTAAALTHLQNAGCLHYLRSLLEKFGDSGSCIHMTL
ncbi:hypothetical protein Dsin_015054 [Dipteronia sinensis]|uniref:Uncharacterized protein n=1 Tax=Dipteronia sinensis TaxID=43782 RepID=A0AAE0AP80_9ROSI|nr:hypothetical protein Dsin_015054 [Dipteronia sinensis]